MSQRWLSLRVTPGGVSYLIENALVFPVLDRVHHAFISTFSAEFASRVQLAIASQSR